MEMLAQLVTGVGNNLFYLAAFIFVLTVVVFIHEMGHFLVARWCGVKVQTFSIGFGEEIWGFNDRHGTRWRIAWIPLGGYVKFMDDENIASAPSQEALARMSPEDRAGAFQTKPLSQRAAVVVAGPVANFVFAIAIFAVMYLIYGAVTLEPRVGVVFPDSAAAKAGFAPGDVVRAIDGYPIDHFGALLKAVGTNPGRELTFEVERNGSRVTLQATPELREHKDPIAGRVTQPMIGIQVSKDATRTIRSVGPFEAVGLGVRNTSDIVTATFAYLRNAILGYQKLDQIGGVVRIFDVSGEMAKLGHEALIRWIAIISVSVGLINLFPIPLLDGGHLMFYAVEAIRGRPLGPRAQEIGFRIGLAFVLTLMVFALWNDRVVLEKWFAPSG